MYTLLLLLILLLLSYLFVSITVDPTGLRCGAEERIIIEFSVTKIYPYLQHDNMCLYVVTRSAVFGHTMRAAAVVVAAVIVEEHETSENCLVYTYIYAQIIT